MLCKVYPQDTVLTLGMHVPDDLAIPSLGLCPAEMSAYVPPKMHHSSTVVPGPFLTKQE